MFGEVSAVLGCRSDVTTICKNYCKLAYLKKKDYEYILTKYPSLREYMSRRIKTYMTNPVNKFFIDHFKQITILKDLTKKNAREVSFHFYVTRFQDGQDILCPGDQCKAVYIVMNGVVGVYVRLKTGQEVYTDFLGVGSVIGQYSMVEQDIMMIGFRCVSTHGALLIQLQRESIDKLILYNEQMRQIKAEYTAEVVKSGVNPFDFLRFNGNDQNRTKDYSMIKL